MTPETKSSEKTVETRRAPVLALVLVAAVAFAAAIFYRDNPLVTRAQAYAQSVATASAATYLSLRTVNAFLSTVQEVEVNAGVVLGGAAMQPFKFLEPIDDTIERIAGLIFATMVITGLLAVVMGPASAVGAVLIGGAACLWLVDRIPGRGNPLPGLARRLGWYGLFIAVALPAAFLVSSLVADTLTNGVWSKHKAVVEEITAQIPADENEPGSWRNPIEVIETYRELASNLYNRADELIASYIAILSVFLFKILLLPLLLTGALLAAMRNIARRG